MMGAGPASTEIADRGMPDEVMSALDELPEEYRAVVLLVDVNDLSYKDVARALGCPLGTVMSRLHRARRALGRRLAGYAAARASSRTPWRSRRRDGQTVAEAERLVYLFDVEVKLPIVGRTSCGQLAGYLTTLIRT
jgi:predicted RNA polymerase sigma factor